VAVAGTDPAQARACLRQSSELSTALGYQSGRDLFYATGIAFQVGDQAATLELGRAAIRGLQWSGERLQMGIVLYMMAGALAATRPDVAAVILGAAGTQVAEPPLFAQLISSSVMASLDDERGRELRAHGADMKWDEALAYTLTQATQATQARSDPGPPAQP